MKCSKFTTDYTINVDMRVLSFNYKFFVDINQQYWVVYFGLSPQFEFFADIKKKSEIKI